MFDRPEWEDVGVMVVYVLLYVFIIDPIYGMTIGVGEPVLSMIRDADHRTAWATNLRTWILIISGAIVTVGYMNIKPRLVGEYPEEYWNHEANDLKD